MKYFLIAGEASGDLHASHLMQALRREDPEARFRCYGGDLMQAAGGELRCHYRELAYMGFIPVLLHLPRILEGMRRCKKDIAGWKPDAVILVDYPGFNLSIARYVSRHGLCPVFYYIAPKIWAWKERRIHRIRRDVTRLFSILPFEVDFFEKKHHYPISYVGNPTLDEVCAYRRSHPADPEAFAREAGLGDASQPVIALLPGSRRQEVRDNLRRMLQAAVPLAQQGYALVVACAPSLPDEVYGELLSAVPEARAVLWKGAGGAFRLLSHSSAALVTSGTATLETTLFRVPQVVCYYVSCGRLVSFLRRMFLKVPYISLVNLIAGREVVPELVADGMTVGNVRRHLFDILPGTAGREAMLRGYEEMTARLGREGAPVQAAREMVSRLARR